MPAKKNADGEKDFYSIVRSNRMQINIPFLTVRPSDPCRLSSQIGKGEPVLIIGIIDSREQRDIFLFHWGIAMFRSCLILIFVLFSPVLLFSQTGFLAPSLLPAGRYKSDYPSGKAEGCPPGINRECGR